MPIYSGALIFQNYSELIDIYFQMTNKRRQTYYIRVKITFTFYQFSYTLLRRVYVNKNMVTALPVVSLVEGIRSKLLEGFFPQ